MRTRLPQPDPRDLSRAFDEIEGAVLPSIGLLLDSLLDAAASARAGIDANVQAHELRMLAAHVADLTRQVETLTPPHYAARTRMSA